MTKIYLVEGKEIEIESFGKFRQRMKIWCGKDGVLLQKGEKVENK